MSYTQVFQAWKEWKKLAKKGDHFLVPGTTARVDCDEADSKSLKVTVVCRTAKHSEVPRYESDEVKFFQVLSAAGSEDAESMLQDYLKDKASIESKLLGSLEFKGEETLKGELEVFCRFLNEMFKGERDKCELYIERSHFKGEVTFQSSCMVTIMWEMDRTYVGHTDLVVEVTLDKAAEIWENLKKEFQRRSTLFAALTAEASPIPVEETVSRVEATTKDLESLKAALEAMHNGVHNGFQLNVCGNTVFAKCEDRSQYVTVYSVKFNDVDCGVQHMHDDMFKDNRWHIAYYNTWRFLSKEKNEKLSKDSGGQVELDQGLRYNSGKNRLDLIPCSLIDGVGRVLTFGAQKYAPDNWRKFNQQQVRECIGSAMRHIEQYRQGNWLDPESGLPHLAHAATNLGFILELHKED